MTEVTVPSALPLVTVPNVELMHVGQWPISTGMANFTSGDLTNAVAALECPAVRRPVLKLGHMEPDPDEQGMRWDGEPAIGYIANLATVESGQTLVGDYTGMPGWLTPEVLASAYPDRSIEGRYDHKCQLGHTHPFVLTAVALLGVTPPGIGTLQSLQDVAALYGVAASAPEPGDPVTITVHAAREDAVPNPNPAEVRAGVTSDDVRRAFYGSEYGRGWDIWICEMQLGPELQLIVTDDSTGTLSRVPVTIGEGDGEDAVTFADPIRVVVRYEDAAVAASAEADQAGRRVVFASRAESRPGDRPAAAEPTPPEPLPEPTPEPDQDPEPTPEPQDPPADPADPPAPPTEGAGMDPALLRQALGLSPEASDEEVTAALAASGLAPLTTPEPEPIPEPEPEPTPAPALVLPPGVTTIDEAALAELLEKAEQGVAARAQQISDRRSRLLDDAVKAGKFPPARREHWENYHQQDPEGAEQALASLAPGLVPVSDQGVPGGAETSLEDAAFAEWDNYFSKSVPTRQGA